MISFAFAGFIAGSAAIAVPIILHFIKRKPTVPEPFPAFKFLYATVANKQNRNNIRKWLILLLRCLCLLCLSLAFAWPYFPNFAKKPDSVTVLLWDNSFSMQASPYREELEKKAVDLISKADDMNPILLGMVAEHSTKWSCKFSNKPESLLNFFKQMNRGEGSSRFEHSLKQADARLSMIPAANKKIILITDRQSLPWKNVKKSAILSPGIDFELITPKHPGFNNVAILSAKITTPFIHQKQTICMEISIKNFLSSVKKGHLKVYLGDKQVAEGDVIIKNQGLTLWRCEFPVAQLSPQGGKVELTVKDDLKIDNTRWFALNPEKLPKVIIFGAAKDKVDFLQLAFSPEEDKKNVETHITHWQKFKGNIEAADMIVVREAFPIMSEIGKEFKKSVLNGKTGAIIWNDSESMRKLLLHYGIKASFLSNNDESHFGNIDFQHPLFKRFMEVKVGGLFNILFFHHPQIDLPHEADILASFSDGLPAIAEMKIGKGRLIIIASSLDMKHTDWFLSASFLPFWRELLSYAQKNETEKREFTVDMRAVRMPGTEKLTDIGTNKDISLKNNLFAPLKSGNYSVTLNSDKKIVSVNVPCIESDPTTIDKTFNWRKLISPDRELKNSVSTAGLPYDQGKSFWRYLLLIAFIAAFAELFLANRTAL